MIPGGRSWTSVGRRYVVVLPVVAVVLLVVFGCSEDVYVGGGSENQPPGIRMTNGPRDGDTTAYRVRFFWLGTDPDGWIDHYEFVVVGGDPIGFDPSDTAGVERWNRTERTDSVFVVSADEYEGDVEIDRYDYSRYNRSYTFFVRAVDNRGVRSGVVYRSFTAWTLAPYVVIESPRNPSPGASQTLSPRVTFGWWAKDPVDMPWNDQDADSVRYLLCGYFDGIVGDMNAHPEKYDTLWSDWIWYHAVGDSGRSTVVGDDEDLRPGEMYVFAVQAKDEAGAVTSIFDAKRNVRIFRVVEPAGPLLEVRAANIGRYTFLGQSSLPVKVVLPEGFPINMTWEGSAASYGCEVSSYRYGWDISDYNDPDSWSVYPSPYVKFIPETRLYSGMYTLYIEAVDNLGTVTLAQFEFEIIPVTMERNLLWVDDLYSLDFVQKVYAYPTETEHDDFWLKICKRVEDFVPDRDVYDSAVYNFTPPGIELVWKYKNILWTYTSDDRVTAWHKVVRFIPESWEGTYGQFYETMTIDYLPIYLAYGGHIWTEGRSDRGGGLGAVLCPGTVWIGENSYQITPNAQVFPSNLRCEITGPMSGCAGDRSGVYSMAYKDYCVSVLDKMDGLIKQSGNMPVRYVEKDAMNDAYRDDADPLTADHPGLPRWLELWDQVTAPGMFFDKQERGFTYAEVYDPEYWMIETATKQQACLHPMYRMRARTSYSPLHKQTVAFWATKYADVVPAVQGGVAAPSVHFGLPLWFFDRAQVDSIANVIFEEWQILGE